MPASKTAVSKVLRVAVIVDELVCDEVHQSEAGPISVGSDYRSDVVLFGSRAPVKHSLFDYRGGHYFLDVPAHTKGKISLGSKALTIGAMRKRYGAGDKLRVKLSGRAKGKLVIGESTILFQFAKPKALPPVLPFPVQFKPRLDNFVGRREQGSLAASAAVLGSYFIWAASSDYDDSFDTDDIDDRFKVAMGVSDRPDEPEPEPEDEEQDELALEDEEEQPEEEDKPEPKPTKQLDKKPEKFSKAAMKEARGVGIALSLGHYGGPGEGTVFDHIQDTENNLGDLFAQGMTTTVLADGGNISPFVPGGKGIDQFGASAENSGFQTGAGPELENKGDGKKERKIKGRARAKKTDIFGDVDKKALRLYIKRRTTALQSCYNKALRTQPDLAGKMSYTIDISTMGNVTKVQVEEDTLGSSSVKACTTAKIRGWRFPRQEDTAEINFSVVFSGGA